jgi:hypothetical protein
MKQNHKEKLSDLEGRVNERIENLETTMSEQLKEIASKLGQLLDNPIDICADNEERGE